MTWARVVSGDGEKGVDGTYSVIKTIEFRD